MIEETDWLKFLADMNEEAIANNMNLVDVKAAWTMGLSIYLRVRLTGPWHNIIGKIDE